MRNLFLLFFVAATSYGCAQKSKSAGDNAEEIIAKRVSKSEFKSEMESLQDYQLVDVRTPSEYAGGTIGKAINIDFLGDDFNTEINKLDKTKPTLIFCQSGGRSAKALKVFESSGFAYLLELEGGYGNW